ncbi:LPXTG-motif cell wall-anchored protein [Streptomyces sp. 1114.5]|uniref:LPXTG cell wall anchor domain-containing protein n=1 Tax=unclassified Streptomyces TaxID=2593676 RepID=UPI000BD65890|nr:MULTISPECIES: LPXTG cell wall anchor domain-containing protein [unclassified Streptomyces]RKT08888.1 LPXTG-motif cell wall-anchored protein [Streptomyces sp. 1114.5]SOB79254.1 LPXTG-motif cell wall anchor domain-containing protein [Streptomyces sp. 1331.2]
MRIRSTTARTLVAVPTAAALMLLAPAAHAAAGGGGKGGAPGNNGTVKIHDAATGQEDVRNEPKVCTFYLDSFGFDANQDVIWAITTVGGGPKEKLVAYGDLPVDGKGHVRTEDIHLPDGHYKLYWQSVELVGGELPKDPQLNNPKHKVFKVDCGGETPAPTGKPSPTVKPTPTKTPSSGPTTVPTTPSHTPSAPASPSAPATATPTTKPSETPSVTPTTPAPTTSAPVTPAPTAPATDEPTDAPNPGPSTPPTATVPVHTPTTDTQVSPDAPLQLPAKVSVPTPIPGATSDGKNLASTGSDGTLLYAGAGTVLLLGGAGAVVYTRRRRTSS